MSRIGWMPVPVLVLLFAGDSAVTLPVGRVRDVAAALQEMPPATIISARTTAAALASVLGSRTSAAMAQTDYVWRLSRGMSHGPILKKNPIFLESVSAPADSSLRQ